MSLRVKPQLRAGILIAVSVAAIVAVLLHRPIAQPAGYHEFADQRMFFGVANFCNVLSNLPFLLIGLCGIYELALGKPEGVIASLRPAYYCLFIGVALVALGSGYYHLAPSNDALTYDRLPMTIAFMAFFAIVVGEHIDPRIGLRLLLPLLLLGATSVLYWHFSERAGHGDLRMYVIVQFLPLLLVPLILVLYPSRLSEVWLLWALLGAYVVSKLLEKADDIVFGWGHVISGHTLKHLSAGLAMVLFLIAIRRRHPIGPNLDSQLTATTPQAQVP